MLKDKVRPSHQPESDVKKKKRPSVTEIVVDSRQQPKQEKRKPKVTPEQLRARGNELEREAREATKGVVRNSEADFKEEYDRMLMFNSRLIRRMNKQLQTALTSRDIYALSTLMSQQREVINDLRAITDLSGQVDMLFTQSVNPFMSDMTQLVTDVYYQLRKLLMETTKPKETQFALQQLDELIKQIGLGLQTNHGMLRQSIESILLGAAPETVKTKRKRV